MNKKIALVTYTNSVMSDVWPLYFGQLDKHAPELKSYVFCDSFDKNSACLKNHNLLQYNNSDHYYKQYMGCLERVEEDYIIYSQEDFFLYDSINYKKIHEYCDFLDRSDHSFVRLIRAGYRHGLDVHAERDLWEVDINSDDAFSMQVTLWKKSQIKKLYDNVKSEKWLEADHWNVGCRDSNISGVFCYNGENKKGKFHYDSLVYPYTCTGINRGKWNINEYGDFLLKMFKVYNIDPDRRGLRLTYNQYTEGIKDR